MARLTRIEFGAKLKSLETGTPHAYFQPPTGKAIDYPCFIYTRAAGRNWRADDTVYLHDDAYDVLYITSDPDTDMPTRVRNAFSHCSEGKPYVKDNLYHYPFNIYNT